MKNAILVAALAATLALPACRTTGLDDDAVAMLDPRSGSTLQGTVRFKELDAGMVRVRVDVTGVAANAAHGFHVHETGDCSAADASSAGGHFNPTGAPHGAPTDVNKHTGDFGNITSDANGEIHQEFVVDFISLEPGTRSILEKAIVLHAERDDLTSQPSGNSGARIGCGIIKGRI